MIESSGQSVDPINVFRTTPSHSGLLYKLKNNSVILIPSDFNENYPGFIFETEQDFDVMLRADFFPIDRKFMTIWEMERQFLGGLPQTVDHFKSILLSRLKYNNEIKSLPDLKSLYDMIAGEVKGKKPLDEKRQLMISFAIVLIDYLVKTKDCHWLFEKRYEMYNSYTYPLLKTEMENEDVIRLVYSSLANEADFDFLIKSI